MSDQGFTTKQLQQLKDLFDQQTTNYRREMVDMFDRFEKKFEKKFDAKLDALETRLGTMIFEIVNEGISPKFDDHELRLRAVERTLKFAQ